MSILIGLALVAEGIFFFTMRAEYDLELFNIITLDGKIAFAIIGVVACLLGLLGIILAFVDNKKE